MSSLLLALVLTAWPLPRDAGTEDYANPANWPREPEWSLAWPLYSFTPPGFALSAAESDAGVGMRVDRAWSITRGNAMPNPTRAITVPDATSVHVTEEDSCRPIHQPDAGPPTAPGRSG